MMFQVNPVDTIRGDIIIPGDKSISHRAILLSAIANGTFFISNLCGGEDVLHTINAMRALGVEINIKNLTCEIDGVGLHGLTSSKNPINCGNSGTLMRLLCGLLSAQSFNSILVGDQSLMQRPMLRIAEPLRLMGAEIYLSSTNTAPIEIIGDQELHGIQYELQIPSAQVKSGILLASLYAEGETTVRENIPTRDHTEKMLEVFSKHLDLQHKIARKNSGQLFKSQKMIEAPLPRNQSNQNLVRARWMQKKLNPTLKLKIPGDISSAAFFIIAATIIPNSNLIIRQVGINPFRTGIIAILKQMGAQIEIFNETVFGLEPVADIHVKYAH